MMTAVLILVIFGMSGATDGGVSLRTEQIHFDSLSLCESAKETVLKEVRSPAARSMLSVNAVCVGDKK